MRPIKLRTANGLAAVGVALVLAAGAGAARGATVTLWACHGPGGAPLGIGPFVPLRSGDGVVGGSGCESTFDPAAGEDDPLSASFDPSVEQPRPGSRAGWTLDVPSGVTLQAVTLYRQTVNFAGGSSLQNSADVPDDGLTYLASAGSGTLESGTLADGDGAVAGSATFPASGSFVNVALYCDPVLGNCEEPIPAGFPVDLMGPAVETVGLKLSSVALVGTDDAPPEAAVSGVASPAAGVMSLGLTATDPGLGLASASASVDGTTVASTTFQSGGCVPLSSSGGLNLALDAPCPASVSDVPLPVDTTKYADGPHQLVVRVTDIAGNTVTPVDETIHVLNHPAQMTSSELVAIGTGSPAPNPAGSGHGSGVGGVSTSTPACLSPRLSAALIGHPLRVARHHDVPILWQGTRYLFSGRLTCAIRGRRVPAPDNTVVNIEGLIHVRVAKAHGRTPARFRIRTIDHTGAAVYNKGLFRVLLHPETTRTLLFQFGTGRKAAQVAIFIFVTRRAYPRPYY